MSLRVAGSYFVRGFSPLVEMAAEAIDSRMVVAGARRLSRGQSAIRRGRAPPAQAVRQLWGRGSRGPGMRPLSGGTGFVKELGRSVGGFQVALSVSDRFDAHAELATAG